MYHTGHRRLRSFGTQRRGKIHHDEHCHRLYFRHKRHRSGAGAGYCRTGGSRQALHRLPARAAAAVPGYDGGGISALCRGIKGRSPQNCALRSRADRLRPRGAARHRAAADRQFVQGLPPAGGHCRRAAGGTENHYTGRAYRRAGPRAGSGGAQPDPRTGQEPHGHLVQPYFKRGAVDLR